MMPDSSEPNWDQLLTENAYRRNDARHELSVATLDLGELLVRGQEAGQSVSGMAMLAQVSRETAHKLLREARADANAFKEDEDDA